MTEPTIEEIRKLADLLEFGRPGSVAPMTIFARSPEAKLIARLLRKLTEGGFW